MRIKPILKKIIMECMPKFWVTRRLRKRPQSAEIELSVMPTLARPDWIAVDVGANYGLYTRVLQQCCAKVHAFEPTAAMARLLRRTVASNVIVHEQAVSDKPGAAEIFIPQKNSQEVYSLASLDSVHLASLDSARLDGTIKTQSVNLVSLDTVLNEPVHFIKIDVEGHEMSVLRGAEEVIARSRPIFLVEAEEQHRKDASATVFQFFRERGYSGFFVRAGRLVSIDEFDVARDQNPAVLHDDGGRAEGTYYSNNFFFTANPEATEELHRAFAVRPH